jgi:hypothetical protein
MINIKEATIWPKHLFLEDGKCKPCKWEKNHCVTFSKPWIFPLQHTMTQQYEFMWWVSIHELELSMH